MVKLIIGLKGTGKTKTLINLVNTTVDTTDGCVVCVAKGNSLIHEIKYQARLINTDDYYINSASTLFGLIAGIYASNHDAKDIFIDSALKICKNDVEKFEHFMLEVEKLSKHHGINFVITSSIAEENLPESLKKFL